MLRLDRRPRAVRFADFRLDRADDGHYRARVDLDRRMDATRRERHSGAAETADAGDGAIRCAAEAAVDALRQVVGASPEDLALEQLEQVTSFGEVTVVVAVWARDRQDVRRLVGFCVTQDDPGRAAVLAVLNATNRFLGTG